MSAKPSITCVTNKQTKWYCKKKCRYSTARPCNLFSLLNNFKHVEFIYTKVFLRMQHWYFKGYNSSISEDVNNLCSEGAIKVFSEGATKYFNSKQHQDTVWSVQLSSHVIQDNTWSGKAGERRRGGGEGNVFKPGGGEQVAVLEEGDLFWINTFLA